jgi:hypothetical protein
LLRGSGAGTQAHLAAQGIAGADGLDGDQARRTALVVGRAAHAREGGGGGHGQAQLARLGGEGGNGRLVARDDRVAAEQLARITCEAMVEAIGEEADGGEGGDGEGHGDHQQTQLAGAEVAGELAQRELPDGNASGGDDGGHGCDVTRTDS